MRVVLLVLVAVVRFVYRPIQTALAADSQALSNWFRRHWSDWFTFLTRPEVSPDNDDAERGLRPVVIHRKVTGDARSDWSAQLVAMMFSFIESMRRQGKNAVDHLFELIALSGCLPPLFHQDNPRSLKAFSLSLPYRGD